MKMDSKKIASLFQDFYESLHRYAFTLLKDNDAAKDAVQAVFLNLLEKKETLQIEHAANAYLFRSVYNHCMSMLKKEKALAAKRATLPAASISEQPIADAVNSEDDIKEKIDSVLGLLPTQCRIVFMKSRVEEKKYKEIAEELNLSVKTVEAHIGKALKLIREALRVFVIIFVLLQS
jgi:RNA polymerase sigma-70 factor (ECF subfamily)